MNSKETSQDLVSGLGHVGVLYGGLSSEREISLQSGKAVLEALLAMDIHATGIDLSDSPISQIQAAQLDRVFIVLHGPGGEDGTVQGLLNLLHLPYTGSGMLASALAMDKLKTKCLWRGLQLPTPDSVLLESSSNWDDVLEALGGEVFVKPVSQGSSFGMARVSEPSMLERAYCNAQHYDRQVMAEQCIHGSEYTVALLNDRALPTIGLKTNRDFYDFEAKYLADDTQYLCPCGLSAEKEAEISELALQAFSVLGCEGWGRVDFMADSEQNFYLLEANTIPGMTSHSLVPMAAQAYGLSFEQLVLQILLTSCYETNAGTARR